MRWAFAGGACPGSRPHPARSAIPARPAPCTKRRRLDESGRLVAAILPLASVCSPCWSQVYATGARLAVVWLTATPPAGPPRPGSPARFAPEAGGASRPLRVPGAAQHIVEDGQALAIFQRECEVV